MTDQTNTPPTVDSLRTRLGLDTPGIQNAAYTEAVERAFVLLVGADDVSEYTRPEPSRLARVVVRASNIVIGLALVWATLVAIAS